MALLALLGLGASDALATPKLSPGKPRLAKAANRPAKAIKPPKRVAIFAPAHGERLLYRPFDDNGRLRKSARRELSHLLRCAHTGQEKAVDLRLVPLVYRMGQHFAKPVIIFSGYRPPALSTRPRSRHLSASAIDFQISGVKNDSVVKYLRHTFHPIGVGYYPDGSHIHVDVDRQVDTFWVQRGSDRLPLGQRLARAQTKRRAKRS